MTDVVASTRMARIAPQPTLATEAFWRSGADGRLRVARCTTCGKRMHPPLPICARCRGRDIEMAEVSGKAVVVGFTVNAQPFLPGYPPPYVVAIVALDEDPDVRLTTNIVGCDPPAVHVGMRVRVIFEQVEEVWLPLFEPDLDAAREPGPVPQPRDVGVALRPMVRTTKYEDQVAITGVGQSSVGRRLMVDPVSLTVDSCLEAIADAGLELSDIDGISTYPGGQLEGGFAEGGLSGVEEALRIRPT
jgi:uncharacterized OB-fold protein